MRCIADVFLKQKAKCILKNVDILIGTVGMGYEDTVCEVEMAYFLDEEYQGCDEQNETAFGLGCNRSAGYW